MSEPILATPDTRRLPARVARAIRAEEDRGERLIGWFQLGIVSLFAALYFVSPAAEGQMLDPGHWIFSTAMPEWLRMVLLDILRRPVPFALALYLAATVVRLVWSYRGRLPGWALVTSIIIDITLLMGLIWSFHIQYGQPAAFYLKAPTVLYVFIFIGLRALRFDERYVLATGCVAAAGWFFLVLYAALSDPTGVPATRNYIEYMTSPKILFGAEIDKIVTIAVVSLLLWLAIRNARRLLVRAVVEGEAAGDLKRFFAPAIADRITGATERVQAGEGRICEATALFVDLRDFTALARRLEPNDTVRLLADYQSRLAPVIEAHGGTIDKFLGDGIMASFGCATASDTHARDALHAAVAAAEAGRSWREERGAAGLPAARVGVGAAAGRVLFGAVGSGARLEYTVIGDAVNLAAKLEKHTKAEAVDALTDGCTYDLAVRQGFSWAGGAGGPDRRPARVAGVDEPVEVVILAGGRGPSADRPGAGAHA
jgi:adenylate cyclase